MEKKLMWILTNWKSNLSAVTGFTLVGLYLGKIITTEQFITVCGSLASLALLIHNEKPIV